MNGRRSRASRWGALPVVAFLGTWEVVARLNLVPGNFLFPPFSAVMIEFYRLIANGVLLDHFFSSLVRVLVGLATGCAAGIGVGILMGWKEAINRGLHPIFSLLYPIPALGWLPFLMLWVGVSELLPIAIVFICSFFPVLYNTTSGIRNVNRDFVRVATTLGACEREILLTVLLPLALPSIFTGLRLEAGMAWRVIIAAEMVAIPTGIGALMMKAESLIRIDIIIVCLMVLSLMCFLLERLFLHLEERLTASWR